MANRLAQVSGHITNAYGRGLLAGEVAIITGTFSTFHRRACGTRQCSDPRCRTGVFVHKVDAKCELNTVPFGQIGHRQECSIAVCQRGRQSRRQRVSSDHVGMHGAVVVDM